MRLKWSAVVPVYKEWELMLRTIPSWFECEPTEMIISVDDPIPDKRVEKVFYRIAEDYPDVQAKIVRVSKDHGYLFHQAFVRRKGYLEAENDRILTGDVDLILKRKPVYKALSMVDGKNNVGLVSLNKFRSIKDINQLVFVFIEQFLRKVAHGLFDPILTTTTFTGLHVFWRPYWLDTEDQEEMKRFVNPKQILRGEVFKEIQVSNVQGEDTFFRDAMQKKHKCIYLRDVGAIDLRHALENVPYIQYHKGGYFASINRGLLMSIGRTIIRGQPYYLMGYLDYRRKMFRGEHLQRGYIKGWK